MNSGLTLFLAGDIMTGRGLDQALARSCDPHLHEPHVRSARRYLALAREAHGAIPTPLEPGDIWGDALDVLADAAPSARIVNLETAVTTSDAWWREKGIHYRMHPENVEVLTAAGIDACGLANNHVLDWGREGLAETLETLRAAGISTAGAGMDAGEAAEPGIIEDDGTAGRILLFAVGHPSSGIPPGWRAGDDRAGIDMVASLDDEAVEALARRIDRARSPGDVVVVSIHWGGNWGYEISDAQRSFARGLVEDAGADVVHGHSSHHPKGIEVHGGRPILYGCGDFINDYEGISGYESYRDDLTLAYLPTFDPSDGSLVRFRLEPFRIRKLRLERLPRDDVDWLRERLRREGEALGTRVGGAEDGGLEVRWE